MPPVALAVVAAVGAASISAAIAATPLFLLAGGAFAGIGLSSATLGAIAGGLFSAALTMGGGALLGGAKKGNSANSGAGSALDQNANGLKTIVRLSDDTQKMIYGRARVGGTLVYAETYPTGNQSDGSSKTGDNTFLHMVIVHAGHECDAFEEFYLDNNLVTLDANGFVNESPYKKDGLSYVRIKPHLGSDTQVADSFLINEATNWTSDHRLRGICYTYIRFQYNPDVFPSGISTINVVLRGKKVYDPRTTLTAWSNNAALCQRDYIYSRDANNIPYGFGATASEIDDTFTIASANICDESITLLDTTTISRYTMNGAIDTSKSPLNVLDEMLSASIGTVTIPLGKFRIYAGAYDTPETTVVDESFLSGEINSTLRISRQDLSNAIRGLYIDPAKEWQSVSFPERTSATYEAEDNGERIYKDIALPFTTNSEAAQRIARTILLKGREQISVQMPCNYKAMQFAVWDTIKVTNTAHGWSEKVFRINNMTFEIKDGVVLHLREENSLSYSWTATDGEVVANAPDTNLPSAFIVNVPTGVAYTSRAVSTVGGDTIYNLVMTWAAYNNSFVSNGGQFEIQFKLAADTDWRPSFYVAGDFTSADIVSSSVNTLYDLRIRAINVIGVRSNWVTLTDCMIGSSGGVTTTNDWGEANLSPTYYNDYGNAADAPTTFNDWGSVV